MAQEGVSPWRQLFATAGEMPAASAGDPLADAYREATSRLIAQRAPLIAILFLFFIGNGSLLEAWFFPERLRALIAVCTIETIVCIVHVAVVRRRPEWAWPAAASACTALMVCMSCYFAVSRGSAEMLAIGLTLFLTGTVVVFPWRARGQAVASAGGLIAYTLAMAGGLDPAIPGVYGVFTLVTAGLITTLGAHLFDQHRWVAFSHAAELRRAHDRQRQETEVSNALLNLTEVLNETLSDPRATAEQLNEHARTTLGFDWCTTYLLDEARQVFRAIAVAGPKAELFDEIRAVEIPKGSWRIYELLQHEGVFEIVDRQTQDVIPPDLLARWHARSMLACSIARGTHVVGVLVGGYSNRPGPFSAMQRRLLQGIAQHAAVALENARLMETAREANRIKSEFVATVSHELRTPLNVILGYTDLLLEEALGALSMEQSDALTRLRTRSMHLLDLIQETLDLNRLESGRIPLTIEDFSVGELLQSVRTNIPATWRRAAVQLEWDSSHDHLVLRSDRGKVEMVVRNLVHNALKYTEHGVVAVGVAAQPVIGAIEFSVRDTGPGIPETDLPKIFEMFQQVNGTLRRLESSGVGLGLYIVRRLLEVLGGSVSVTSRIGHGSCFTVSLPIRPAPGLSPSESAEP
ncbi:MAG TPA: GAF domain-containing sensor histidine kinase [Candidatus Kryptonia bacterium]|nr:GAF domain-containing sensor histidine kinase [Candidatus Kryptonia bacterium]